MNCHAYHDLLQQRLDGAPVESPELIEHLRGCPNCRALEAATRRLQDVLRSPSAPLPPADLAARIAERVIRERRRARRRARRRWVVTAALAAGLFLALALRLDWRGRDTESEKPGRVVKNVTPPPISPPSMGGDMGGDRGGGPAPVASPTLRETVTEAGEAVAALTSQTAGEAVGPTRWLVPNVPSPELPKVDLAAIEPPTRPLREAGEGVSAGLEPVTNSARRALGLFLRELPPMDSGQNGL